MVNLSTGPIALNQEIYDALTAETISHRSSKFQQLHRDVINFMSKQLNTKEIFVLQGSGTLANEVMLWQIKIHGGRGIVFSNGEFGNRLIELSERVGLNFIPFTILWGEEFKLREIENLIDSYNVDWILFTHCETSTGVVNNLNAISEISSNKKCKLFVDCMSTIGTAPIDLSKISMATGSSGKGLCSLSGIALVFSNIEILKCDEIPKYFDLHFYKLSQGIPFTFSSNQLEALSISIQKTMDVNSWRRKDLYSKKIYTFLKPLELIPFATDKSRVFTIVQTEVNSEILGLKLSKCGLLLSYQSSYLKKRNWIQLTLFGTHDDHQIEFAMETLKRELCLTKPKLH